MERLSLVYFSIQNTSLLIGFWLLSISGSYSYARSETHQVPVANHLSTVNRPLIWAIQENNLQKVTALLIDKKNINNQDFLGYSPLHYAAKYAKATVVACLLEANPLLNQISVRNGHTPLLLAIERGHKKIVSLLLAAGADPNILNHRGCHPLQLAIQQNRKDLVQLLLQAGAICNATPNPLFLAIKGRRLPIIRLLLAHKQIIETEDKNGYTALHWAAKQNSPTIFQTVLKSGHFNINAKAANGATPLHLIVANKKSKLLKTLRHVPFLEVNIQDRTGSTPLHYAVVMNQLDVVSGLLRYPSLDVNVPNHLGQTPLHYAVQCRHTAIIKKLLVHVGNGLSIQNKAGITPLELAMHQNNTKIYKLMLAYIEAF
ncbi:ankyrin repeat domain-containing protein [Candidatus Cardinium hertigii]|uniref:ankyrin repeat domain-containing protein n=1 Tax=Candidatus Cardinium hertigii TaxID=247481 RepID=UPI003D7EDD40